MDVGTFTSECEKVGAFSSARKYKLSGPSVYLCVVPVIIEWQGKQIKTYAFLDQRSTHSFCDIGIVNELGITGRKQSISLQTLATSNKSYEGLSFDLNISDLKGKEKLNLSKVLSIDEIPIQPNAIPLNKDLSKLSYLHDVTFDTIPGGTVGLLLKADNPELFLPSSTRKGPRGLLSAILTPLGWSLLGPSLTPSFTVNCSVNFTRCNEPSEVALVKQLWETDFQNGTSVLDTPNSKEDRAALQLLTNSVEVQNDHYQLPLLWKPGNVELPNNLVVAKQRLSSLKRKFTKDDDFRGKYTKVISFYLQQGIAQEVPHEHLNNYTGATWYLPHHAVTNLHKPDKVRVVFDCAAKYKGTSLNDNLIRGPDLMNSLIGVLMRFCKERVALVADVEAMFVKPSHVDALRFLWWPNGKIDQEPVVHRMLVHIFGAKSLPTCANFALKQTAAEFGNLFEPNMSEIVNKHFYVDDCLVSLPSVAEAVTTQTQFCDLLSKRGFRLRKWLSNSSEVLDQIPEAECYKALQSYSFPENVSERVLGVHWDVEKDIFTFNVNLREFSNTKRVVLSTIASLYDPLGFVCPIVLEPKLRFQQLCRQKFGWDVSISDPELEKSQRWLNRLQELSHVQIPRCFTPKNLKALKSIEIRNFADASSYAYAACSYFRLVDTDDNIFCAFVIAKSRLAPIKAVSIPRWELTAAVLAVRLNALVKGELNFDVCQSYFWIDSTAALLSILNRSKRFRQIDSLSLNNPVTPASGIFYLLN